MVDEVIEEEEDEDSTFPLVFVGCATVTVHWMLWSLLYRLDEFWNGEFKLYDSALTGIFDFFC